MITRDNYEEFFLLYTDNELSAAERHEVERFVANHPDLHEEWEALLQCRLSPDTHLSFPDREALLKPEVEGSAYTGTLLSYIDGELNNEEQARIETIIRQQPRVAIELAVLRQTISNPDPTLVFPEKDRLYRTDKERRIIPLFWLRIGVAAAVAGTVALLLLLPANRQPATPPVVVAEQHNISPAVTPPPVAALHSTEGQPTTHKDQPAKQLIHKREPQQQQDVALDNATSAKVEPVTADHSTRAVITNAVATNAVMPNAVSTTAIVTAPPGGDLVSNVHLAVQTGIPKEQSSFATQALQQNANDQRNNDFATDESTAPGRGAIRSIFRKVKRTFSKTAERDSDGNRQVLVGAFQVSLD